MGVTTNTSEKTAAKHDGLNMEAYIFEFMKTYENENFKNEFQTRKPNACNNMNTSQVERIAMGI